MIRKLTALVSTVSNSQLFLLKNASSFSHFFSKNISVYAIFNDQTFNDTLTNVSFEQLGPDCAASIADLDRCCSHMAWFKRRCT